MKGSKGKWALVLRLLNPILYVVFLAHRLKAKIYVTESITLTFWKQKKILSDIIVMSFPIYISFLSPFHGSGNGIWLKISNIYYLHSTFLGVPFLHIFHHDREFSFCCHLAASEVFDTVKVLTVVTPET